MNSRKTEKLFFELKFLMKKFLLKSEDKTASLIILLDTLKNFVPHGLFFFCDQQRRKTFSKSFCICWRQNSWLQLFCWRQKLKKFFHTDHTDYFIEDRSRACHDPSVMTILFLAHPNFPQIHQKTVSRPNLSMFLEENNVVILRHDVLM